MGKLERRRTVLGAMCSKYVLFVCWATMCSVGTAHTPSGYFSAENRDLYIQLASQTLSTDAGFTLEAAHYSVSMLSTLEAQVPDKSGACSLAHAALKGSSSSDNLKRIYLGASVNQALNCGVAPANQVTDLLARRAAELAQEMHVKDAFFVIEASLLTHSPTGQLLGLVDLIIQQQQPDGKFATSLETGYALAALTSLSQLDLSEAQKESIGQLCERLKELIASSQTAVGPAIRFLSAGGLTVHATALITQGILNIGSSVDVRDLFTHEQMGMVAQYLLSFRGQSLEQHDLQQAASVVSALSLLNKHQVTAVTVLNQQGLQLGSPPGTQRLLQVDVTDLFGQPVDCTLTATSVIASTSEQEVATDQQFMSSGSSHSLDLMQLVSADVKPEVYVLALQVTPVSSEPLMLERVIKVLVSSTVPSVLLRIGNSKDDAPHASPTELRPTMPAARFQLAAGQWLQAKFEIQTEGMAGFEPHQVQLRFSNVESANAATVACQRVSGNKWEALVSANELAAVMRHTNGPCALSLLVGDIFMFPAIEWKLANLLLHVAGIEIARGPDTPQLELLPLIHLEEEEEIEARPPALVAVVFTALCLVPIGLFVKFCLDTQNLDNFPNMKTAPFDFNMAVAFQGSIVLLTLINVCYWLGLSLAHTLPYLVLVYVFALVCSRTIV